MRERAPGRRRGFGAGGTALVCLLIILTVLVSAWRALTTWETGTWRQATVTAFLLAYGVALVVPLHIGARRSLLLVTVEVASPPLLFLLLVRG